MLGCLVVAFVGSYVEHVFGVVGNWVLVGVAVIVVVMFVERRRARCGGR